MGLPKIWIPFFGTLQSDFTRKTMMGYKTQQKMLCSFKYNSLSSISCKTTPSQRKEKNFKTVLTEALTILIFFPSGLHFYMLRITR